MRPPELDAWLPDPVVRTVHRRGAAAAPERLWQAASSVRLAHAHTIGRLVRWRLPGTAPDVTFRELLASYPFVVLAEGAQWSLSGLCGRIWTRARDYPRLQGPQDFRDWHEPDTVRVLFAHWVEPDGPGRCALVSEARVAPVDRRARLAFRSLWLLVGPFERLIGAEPLTLATRRAEATRP